jgi:hypothetical protein
MDKALAKSGFKKRTNQEREEGVDIRSVLGWDWDGEGNGPPLGFSNA